ncbi:MAG: translesion DNA synthesis-associated protein ImuA [Betaproteobacteria bacterium]|nr:translesion DNA synthesis-associated protein ImuA [Betaproteobacteria bacterium]
MKSCKSCLIFNHPAIWRGDRLGGVATPSVPTGFSELDAALPGGGWPAAALTEILPQHEGIGELRLLGPALAALSAQRRTLVWVAPPYLPYAPALQAAGIDLARLVVVRTRSPKQALWAIEQALRSSACGAVLAWPEEIRWPELRRLQLATEGGRALAVLFRPARAAGDASPAALRLGLDTHAGGLAARILKRRGAMLDKPLLLPLQPVVSRSHSANHAVDRPSLSAPAPRIVPAGIIPL